MTYKNKGQFREKEKIVLLKKFDNELEARIAHELLKERDIESSVLLEDPAGMGLKRGASLMVLENDYEMAIKIMRDRFELL